MSASIKSGYIPLESIASSSTYAPSKYDSILAASESDDDDVSTIVGRPLNPASNTLFTPTSSLQVQTTGKPALSFPLPTKELEIPIFSLVTGRPVYLSIRPERRRGNCRLVRAEEDLETAIARTTYRFGPGRNPVVKIGRDDDLDVDEFEMAGKSLLSRTVGFETRRWGKFEWCYGSKKERALYGADNLLILEKDLGRGERLRIAQLVRNDEVRTPGTQWMAAGNGGRLQMRLRGENGSEEVDEVVVVVTCLVMLKKEIDRLRTIQIMALQAGAG